MNNSIQKLYEPLSFIHGPAMKNRFMLAPLTNQQSHADGRLSDEEINWLIMRAQGGFGLTMTAAAHVQASGQGFPGQLGNFSDDHLPGLKRVAEGINKAGSLSIMQIYHGGYQSVKALIGEQAKAPSENTDLGCRAMTTAEVGTLVEDFILASERAQLAGFDGIEIHGAHAYVVCQFLSTQFNQRRDQYGGSLENRQRVLMEIVSGIRSRCGEYFNLGVRLSPESFGLQLDEVLDTVQRLMDDANIDYIDMSMWDTFKEPADEAYQGRSLMSYFTELKRGNVRLGMAGKMYQPTDILKCLDQGADFVLLGRAGILHHDYPDQLAANDSFNSVPMPVSVEHLTKEGVSQPFIDYLDSFGSFVAS